MQGPVKLPCLYVYVFEACASLQDQEQNVPWRKVLCTYVWKQRSKGTAGVHVVVIRLISTDWLVEFHKDEPYTGSPHLRALEFVILNGFQAERTSNRVYQPSVYTTEPKVELRGKEVHTS